MCLGNWGLESKVFGGWGYCTPRLVSMCAWHIQAMMPNLSNLVYHPTQKSKVLSPIPVAGPGCMPLSRLVCRIIVVSSANIAGIEAVTVILLAWRG